MKTYKLFKDESGAVEAVKQGWSWPAFFFNFIWALVKKMWGLGIGLFAFYIALGVVETMLGEGPMVGLVVNIIMIFVNIAVAANGNALREKNLLSRGYTLVGTVSAKSPQEAAAMQPGGVAPAA